MDSKGIQELYTEKAALYDFFFLNLLGVGRSIKRFFQKSEFIRSPCKVLDVGCGTGDLTKSLWTISREKGYEKVIFHAFDVTQATLDVFQQWIEKRNANNIMWRRADVLHLEQLPSDWNAYDRIVSCGMLEYIQKDQLQDVLNDLWRRLKQDGKLAVFIASKNRMTRLCVERWWKAYTYHEQEIQSMFQASQFREYTITKCRGRSIFMVVAKK